MKTTLEKLIMIRHALPLLFVALLASNSYAEKLPNIVYIMSDELAYYEVGYMGNPHIKTPRMDRMAKEGLMFTNALAGAPVCGPLRCTLMTGKHMGHASVRRNDGGTPIRAEEETIASMLKQKGYATGGFGKWGAGGRGSTGVPEKHGFDVFFGYYDQVHAHSFYPPYIIRNSEEVVLEGNIGGRSGKTYSHYEIHNAAIKFIKANKDKPFFCYLPITPPHGMYDIPQSDPACAIYKKQDWPQDVKNYAAMVSMVDRQLGEVLDLLEELGLEENTIVFFAGDNGGQARFRSKDHPGGFFGPNVNPKTGVEFRGGKGNLYEGGLRVPSIVRWPGKIKPGRVSDLIWYQPDIMPTLGKLTGTKPPKDIDGISILPELIGEDAAGHKIEKREMLYWEYGGQTAVRMNEWKAIRPNGKSSWELYNLSKDISEKNNIARDHPDIVKKMSAFAVASHVPAQPGTFTSRDLHLRDQKAKWGTAKGAPQPKHKGKVFKLSTKGAIANNGWKIASVSSESKGNGKVAKNIIDGDPRTHWHSDFGGTVAKHPHEVVIDLGAKHTIRGFRYLARQDDGWNGAIAKCEIFVSDSKDQFGKVVAAPTFVKQKPEQEVACDPVEGRYVKIRILSEVNGTFWASIAEFGVIGK